MNLDDLNISISSTDKASDNLEKLSKNLMTLSKVLGTVESNGLSSFANGLSDVTQAMSNYKESSVSASTFNSLATSLQKLSMVNSSGLMGLGDSLNSMLSPLQALTNVSDVATSIKDLSKGISTLGNDRVQKATQYLPELTESLKKMMTELANTPKISQNLIDMTNALGNLTRNGQKVGSAMSGINGAFKQSVKPIANINTGTRKMASGFKSLASAVGMFYVKFWMVIRLIKKFSQIVSSTMDYVEAFNFFDVAITNATDDWSKLGYESADSYAKAFEDRLGDLNEKMSGLAVDSITGDIASSTKANLGINLKDLITFESEVVSITSSLGLASKASADTSESLAMLAADMSSLHNIDLSTVFKNFQSGLIGQSRSLYKYGIDITNATLSTYALANGVTKSVQSMTQAEKMQLRVLAIFQQLNGQVAQSENAWGDLSNTINQAANQMRRLTNGFKNLGVMIGKLFLPIVQKTLPYLNAFVIVLQRLAESIAHFFGIEIDANSAATGTSDILDDIEDSAENADDALKSLNKQLAAFDKLNNLTSSSSNVSGAMDMIDLSDEIADAVANYKKVWDEAYSKIVDDAQNIANAIWESFKIGDFYGLGRKIADSITDQLKKINWNEVYKGANNFGSGFAQFLNGIIYPEMFAEVGRTIASSLNTVINYHLSFANNFDFSQLGESIGKGITEFFRTFDWKKFAETLNKWVDGLEIAIGQALENIDMREVIKGLGDLVTNLEIDTIGLIVGVVMIKKIGKVAIANALWNALKVKLSGTFSKIFSGISIKELGINFLKILPSYAGTAGFDVFANEISEQIEVALSNMFPTLSKFFGDFLLGFVTAGVASAGNPIVATIGGLFTTFPVKINWFGEGGVFSFDWAKDWFEHAKEAFKTAFDGNRADILDIGSWIFEGIIDGFVGAIVGIFEPIARFFKEFTEGLKDIFGIHSPAKKMIPYGEYILLGIVEGFTSKIQSIGTAIDNFFKYVSEKLGLTKCKNAFKNLGEGLKSAFTDAISAVKKIWNNFAELLNDTVKIEIPEFEVMGKKFGGYTFGLNIPTFQTGGFPEDGLFMANHNELVGTFSNGRTAVANNDQIVAGIEQGVYNAVVAALANGNGANVNITLEGDADGLFKVIKQQATTYQKRTGNPAFGY